ncbi:MAG: hypothetical protein HY529_04555 [Chloroflexi bacterium]|nr:hypothetical protein [Chloroflexota bacterium]
MLKLASFVGVALVLLAGLGTGCARGTAQEEGKASPSTSSSPSQSPSNGLVQTSSGGGVDIEVEWRGLKDGSLVFGVTMDTHSGSIDQYDLRDLAILRDSSGKGYRPSSSDIPPGGHHRSGLLTFPISDLSNLGTKKYFDLILRDIAGVPERDLRWEMN